MTAPSMLEAFLDDIVAHPEDPSLWLILADWLEEREDPRAELVRLSWGLRHEPEHPDFDARQMRVQALLAGGMSPVVPRVRLAGYEFAWVPPGSFLMGSPENERGRSSDEQQHAVTLTRGFWMGVHPVTQAQWRAVMDHNPSEFSRTGNYHRRVLGVSDAELERFPVEYVSWHAVRQFCTAVTGRLDRTIRLPTEAEWEYACRAGTTTPFHFGEILDGTQANADGTVPYGTSIKGPYLQRPKPVGSFPPNAFGLFDMHGNVSEWCHDAYQIEYDKLHQTDPTNLDGEDRIVRGGNWLADASWCRAAERTTALPETTSRLYGCRICFPAQENPVPG